MNIHKIEHSSHHGTLAILKCDRNKGYLKAFCQESPENFGELVEIQIHPDHHRDWVTGVFENAIIDIRPLRWGASLEEASEGNSQDTGLLWLDLARAGLTKTFDADALREGLLALERVEEAKAVYREAMSRLGFQEYSEGSYEEYRDWLALPTLPFITFPCED